MAVSYHWHIRYKWFGDYITILFNYIFHHYFSCWLISGPSHQCTVQLGIYFRNVELCFLRATQLGENFLQWKTWSGVHVWVFDSNFKTKLSKTTYIPVSLSSIFTLQVATFHICRTLFMCRTIINSNSVMLNMLPYNMNWFFFLTDECGKYWKKKVHVKHFLLILLLGKCSTICFFKRKNRNGQGLCFSLEMCCSAQMHNRIICHDIMQFSKNLDLFLIYMMLKTYLEI